MGRNRVPTARFFIHLSILRLGCLAFNIVFQASGEKTPKIHLFYSTESTCVFTFQLHIFITLNVR